jgi:hypothetical protein
MTKNELSEKVGNVDLIPVRLHYRQGQSFPQGDGGHCARLETSLPLLLLGIDRPGQEPWTPWPAARHPKSLPDWVRAHGGDPAEHQAFISVKKWGEFKEETRMNLCRMRETQRHFSR